MKFILLVLLLPTFSRAEAELKKVNFDQEMMTASPAETGQTLTPQDQQRIMEELKLIKARQEEERKALEELDKEE